MKKNFIVVCALAFFMAQPAQAVYYPTYYPTEISLKEYVENIITENSEIGKIIVLATSLGSIFLADSNAFSSYGTDKTPYLPVIMRLGVASLLAYLSDLTADFINRRGERGFMQPAFSTFYWLANLPCAATLLTRNVFNGRYSKALINQVAPLIIRGGLMCMSGIGQE